MYFIERQLPFVESYAFCMFHKAELEIVPAGIEKGYPTEIDFGALPQRIAKFKQRLNSIIEGTTPSQYQELAETAYKFSRRMAATSMGLWSRFEHLQVIFKKDKNLFN